MLLKSAEGTKKEGVVEYYGVKVLFFVSMVGWV